MALNKGASILFFLVTKGSRWGFFFHPFLVNVCSDSYDKEKTEIQYDLALLAGYKKQVEKTQGI